MTIIAILLRQKTNQTTRRRKNNNNTQKGKDYRANPKMYTDTSRLKQFQGTQFAHTKKVTLKILFPTCSEFFFAGIKAE